MIMLRLNFFLRRSSPCLLHLVRREQNKDGPGSWPEGYPLRGRDPGGMSPYP